MRKRLLSAVVSLVLILSLVPTVAYAASDEAVSSANALYQLGLFKGTGKDAQGNPIFDLDRTPTRYEAVTLLVRLLGRANEAESKEWNTPFTDLTADWAKPYVGYAYANKLTSGTSSGTTYGGNEDTTLSQYITFVLRALGYESGVDFQWDKAWELSDKLGITNGQYNAGTTNFTRGDVVIISYNALSAAVKGTGTTLLEKIRGGASNPSPEDGHVHTYIEQAVPGSGRYEQVQTGTTTVDDYALIKVIGCRACDFTTNDYAEYQWHTDVHNKESTCAGAGHWMKESMQKVGTHKEPVYQNKWVEDTVRVCSICGQQEP